MGQQGSTDHAGTLGSVLTALRRWQVAGGLDPDEAGRPRCPVVILGDVDVGSGADEPWGPLGHDAAPPVIVLVTERGTVPPSARRAADLILAGPAAYGRAGGVCVADPIAAAEAIAARIRERPLPALALVWHLRTVAALPIPSALGAESATYSMLLSGRDFADWLAHRGPARAPGAEGRVRVGRAGDVLSLTLARPERRNAVDAAMRDALWEALQIAVLDESVRVEIDAEGPSFCAGGDLDEFGSAVDPATAHAVRLTRSVGAQLAALGPRVTVRLHGACVGAGIELPAFAGRVVAAPDAYLSLPEFGLGLIPGAGGTVSLPRRIGRHRTAWLALTGQSVDAATALAWGLVDAIEG